MGKNSTEHHRVTVTGGRYSGMSIDTPGEGTHPMGTRERLAVFNMLQGYLQGASVMDAYAGSGILGIEALSRGAKYAIFVEKDELAAKTIEKNLAKIGATPSEADILKLNIKRINEVKAANYDIIFADPPYDKYSHEMVTILAPLVTSGGLLVTSTPVEAPEIPGFETRTRRKYARCHITVYQRA